ncbi:MAG: cytochrome c3 family protein [Pirellulaceae bacterium]
MNRLTLTMVLVVSIGGCLLILFLPATAGSWRMPGNQQGYEPAQPIAFSHHLHAGELGIQCLYCHQGAEKSRTAGIPTAETCMNCHRYVTASLSLMRKEDLAAQAENRKPQPVVSDELRKLFDALAVDETMTPDPQRQQPIAWVRVHDLPDFVYFDHRAHVHAGVTCQYCHGPVEAMQRVRQDSSLSMGWCVNCHREATRDGVNGQPALASIDCVTCHY